MVLMHIIVATTLVGLISFIGLVFFGLKINTKSFTILLVSLASGTLLGGAFLHLIPQSFIANPSNATVRIALGVFLFFVLEKFLIWRHCHVHQIPEDHGRPVAAMMVITGDSIHNFIDGIIIASAFMAGTEIGMSVALAILLHEIPQEMGDFGVLIHGGYTFKKALFLNAVSASFAVFGGVVGYIFIGLSQNLQLHILPIAAGGFLYIALADLIPQLHEQTRFRQSALQAGLVALGFGVIYLLKHAH